jgi:hypothetical protein
MPLPSQMFLQMQSDAGGVHLLESWLPLVGSITVDASSARSDAAFMVVMLLVGPDRIEVVK